MILVSVILQPILQDVNRLILVVVRANEQTHPLLRVIEALKQRQEVRQRVLLVPGQEHHKHRRILDGILAQVSLDGPSDVHQKHRPKGEEGGRKPTHNASGAAVGPSPSHAST